MSQRSVISRSLITPSAFGPKDLLNHNDTVVGPVGPPMEESYPLVENKTVTVGADGTYRGYDNGFDGVTQGSLSPTNIRGETIAGILVIELFPGLNQIQFDIELDGGSPIPQDYFESITLGGTGGPKTFLSSAAASYVDDTTHGTSRWVWSDTSLDWASDVGGDVPLTVNFAS